MKRVLVVDDDPKVLARTKSILQTAGYSVQGCENEYDAIVLSRDFQPEVLITDVCLPSGDGLSLASTLRQQRPNCKIVISTGTLVPLVVNFARMGGYDILQKPIDQKELLSLLAS